MKRSAVLRNAVMLCAAFLLAAGVSVAAPVALVADVVGSASLAGRQLRLLDELDAGAQVKLDAQAKVTLFYLGDGSEWRLEGGGAYRVAAKAPTGSPAPQRVGSSQAFRDLRVRSDGIAQAGTVMRSLGKEPQELMSPAKEVVLHGPVQFEWRPLGPNTHYQLELVDEAGNRVFATETTETAVPLPAQARLVPGRMYYWAVRGKDAAGGRTVYRATEFRYADAATQRRLEAAAPPPGAPFPQRVVYVAMLDRAGARSAARALQRALAAERNAEWAANF